MTDLQEFALKKTVAGTTAWAGLGEDVVCARRTAAITTDAANAKTEPSTASVFGTLPSGKCNDSGLTFQLIRVLL